MTLNNENITEKQLYNPIKKYLRSAFTKKFDKNTLTGFKTLAKITH